MGSLRCFCGIDGKIDGVEMLENRRITITSRVTLGRGLDSHILVLHNNTVPGSAALHTARDRMMR
jgi:hypothetical protein